MNKKTNSELTKRQDKTLTAVIETIEILTDEQFITDVRLGMTEIASGKGIEWEKAKQDILA